MIHEKDRSADGLRGVASASVMFSHLALAFFPLGFVSLYPWLADPHAVHGVAEDILSSPLLISLWNGQLQVCIFFVLSGYVLTRRFFATGDAESIRSQAMRRYLRLAVPVFGSIMLAYALFASGTYFVRETIGVTHSQWLTHNYVSGITFPEALREGSYAAILFNHFPLNHVLWTMRIELIGSMLIFSYCLLAGNRHLIMSALYLVLAASFAPSAWLYYAAFLAGAHIGRMPAPSHRLTVYAALVAGYVVASIPLHAGLWQYLPVAASDRFPLVSVVGGAMIFYAVRFGALSRILQSRPCQLLGSISYPLYLIHVPIILSVGCRSFVWLSAQGNPRWLAASVSALACAAVVLPTAWIFERLVDRPTVRLGRWIAAPRKAREGLTPAAAEHA